MGYNFDLEIDRNQSNSVKYDLRKILFGTNEVIPLWVADMDFQTPDFITEVVKQKANHELYGYSVLPKKYFESIIQWSENRYGWSVKKSWITSCPGVVPTLAVSILAFTQPGDKIIVQPPVYPPFFTVIENNDRTLVLNPLIIESGYYKIDFEDLEQKASEGARMLILCSPHNPVGRVWTKDELQKVGDICLKYNLLIVSDEIHADIIFAPNKFVPTATLSEEIANITISCLAPSKTFNVAGLSSSYTIIPNEETNIKFRKMLAALGLNHSNYFGSAALETAYLNGERWLEEAIKYLGNNVELVDRFLKQYIPEIKMVKPEGTFLLWLDCRNLMMDDQKLKDFMVREAGLGLFDGTFFGSGGSGFMRMNIACPVSILEKALAQLKSAIVQWRRK